MRGDLVDHQNKIMRLEAQLRDVTEALEAERTRRKDVARRLTERAETVMRQAEELRDVTAERDRYEAALYKIASEAAGGEDASDPDECDHCTALIETAEKALESSAALERVEAAA